MAIARYLVELHGGTIEAASEGEGKGATFIVQLPILPDKKEPEYSLPANIAPEALLEGKCVLIVGTEDDTRELTAVILEQSGAQVMTVASVQTTLEALARSQPDLLISTIEFLRRNDYELAQRLRLWSQEFGEEIPVVALADHPEEVDPQELLMAGPWHVLQSVISPDELVEAIARFIA